MSKHHVPRYSYASPWPCLYPELLPAEGQVLGFKASVAMVQPVSPAVQVPMMPTECSPDSSWQKPYDQMLERA